MFGHRGGACVLGLAIVVASVGRASAAPTPPENRAAVDEGQTASEGSAEPEELAQDAGPPGGGPLMLGLYTGLILEILTPDVRYEWGQEIADGWTLSWPVHFFGQRFGRTHLSLFAEGQLQVTGENQGRALGGGRLIVVPIPDVTLGFVAEGGGLLGHDGNGYFAGAGLAWDLLGAADEDDSDSLLPSLSVIYRQAFTGDGRRHDVALDLVLVSLDFLLRN